MADKIISVQELINAQADAKALELIMNEAPWVEVETRLGRKCYSILTIQAIIEQFQLNTQTELQNLQDAIAQIITGVLSDTSVKTWSGRTQRDKNKDSYNLKDFLTLREVSNLKSGDFDITTRLNAAISYINNDGGGLLHLPPMKVVIADVVAASGVHLIGQGVHATKMLVVGTTNGISAKGSIATDYRLLTAEALMGASTIYVDSTIGLSAGDYIIIYDQHTFSTRSAATGYCNGEYARIKTVVDSNTLTLYRPLNGTMKTSGESYSVAHGSRIVKVNLIEDIDFTGFIIEGVSERWRHMISLYAARNINVYNTNLCKFGGSGVDTSASLDINIYDNIIEDGKDDVNNGYSGYATSLYYACTNVNIHNNTMRRVRHAFTTGGGALGYPHNSNIFNNTAFDTTNTAYDTHESGMKINIRSNVADNCAGGVSLRTPKCLVDNNTIYNSTGAGVAFGEAADNIYDNTITNNRIFDAASWGIIGYLSHADQTTLVNNQIFDCGWSGINMRLATGVSADNLNILDNTLLDFGRLSTSQSGIIVTGSDAGGSPVIRGNTVITKYSTGYGINLIAVKSDGVSDNTIRGTYRNAKLSPTDNFAENATTDNLLSAKFSVADDAVYKFNVGQFSNHLLVAIGSASAGPTYANSVFRARTNAAPLCGLLVSSSGASVVYGTGVPTGTTTEDGKLGVYVGTGAIYIENRTGASYDGYIQVLSGGI